METQQVERSFRMFGGELAVSARFTGTPPIVSVDEQASEGHRMGVITLTGSGARLYDLNFHFYLPMRDIHRTFTGAPEMWRGVELVSVALSSSWECAANRYSPVICNFNRLGMNRHCLGLLDTRPEVTLRQNMPNTGRPLPMQHVRNILEWRWPEGLPLEKAHEVRIFFCDDEIPWHEAVRRYVRAHEQYTGRRTWPVPEAALDPVWCSWYAQLEEMTSDTLRREIPYLREAGFGTVTIDAPWFASEQHLAHAGHYTPNDRFRDLPQLVEDFHTAGLRVVLWCAPAMVGHLSPVRSQLESSLILMENGSRTNALCPAHPDSVNHMASTCERLMRDYHLDGLKLDFLDAVKGPCYDRAHHHTHPTLGEAMHEAMARMRDAIRSVKPDALIEYRHRYANVTTRDFASWYRGNDAPYDADYIRRQNAVLRTFLPEGAVLADYACWHPQESLANIGRMMAAMIFTGVPAVSVNLSQERPEARSLVQRWLDYYNRHRDGLVRGDFRVLSPDTTCNVTISRNRESAYVAVFGSYGPEEIDAGDPAPEKVYVYNDTLTPERLRIRGVEDSRIISIGPEMA